MANTRPLADPVQRQMALHREYLLGERGTFTPSAVTSLCPVVTIFYRKVNQPVRGHIPPGFGNLEHASDGYIFH